ncbi:aspartic-type endopeptidase [Ascochyta rabiei]|uniref:Aspartic-type endopeptidase n=1 Tax=Didymella rabiei TaxID=5454 RepID=A0A163JMF5_DIDRA|nr:aspartic-type endopeptidase [Ascochyta rabiei]
MMHFRKRADSNPIPLPPQPKVVNASGTFDGNDGRWSSFIINVNSNAEGLSGQNFKTLISTSSPVTLLPAITDLINNSTNDTLKGAWGISNVGLGESSANSLVLTGRYIAQYIFNDFFMGSFGLAVGEVGEDDSTRATFLSQFEDDSNIASSSYGYTAGAYYRNNGGVLGSLVLGGYDRSRMSDEGVIISMANLKNTTLVVGVQSIIYTPDQNVASAWDSFTAKTGGGFSANIDSTLPYLVLPENICALFQEKFRLQYDEDRNLYFVNSSSHDANKQQNAKVIFNIGAGPRTSYNYTSIALPYAAFDQQIGSETGENFTNYFPIKKSKNGISTLGRTFLQEAYIYVDYERTSFTVAPAHYSDPMPNANIKTILNTTYVPPGSTNTSKSGGGMAPGAIAGTVVGIVAAFVIAGIITFCWWRKREKKAETDGNPQDTAHIDPTLAGQEIRYRRVSELTGSDVPSSPKTHLGGYYTADHKSIPPISEMSPDSPPVELYSPPPESASDVDGARDYFTVGKPHRRGAQRDRASSGQNSPGTPIAELPGDEGQFHTQVTQIDGVSPLTSPRQSHGPSDISLSKNIDERPANQKKDVTRPTHPAETARADAAVGLESEAQTEDAMDAAKERRPSHQRGLSDNTIASDSTAVSQPTPEEEERWAREPRRPFSE